MTFKVDRKLLNPRFDGYKLATLDEHRAVTCVALPAGGLSQSTVSTSSHLSFQEVQARIRFNHLAVGYECSEYATFAYVDMDHVFTLISITKASLEVTYHRLFEIPRAVQSNNTESEYPTSIFIHNNTWILSDGTGRLYALRTSMPPTAATLSFTSEIIQGNSVVPCRLHSAILQDNSLILLVSSRGNVSHSNTKKASAFFDLAAYRIPFRGQDTLPAILIWRKHGTDIPSYVHATAGNYLVCAGSTFVDPDTQIPASKMTENIGSTSILSKEAKQPTTRPPPYSWTQTSDSLTVAFPLPSTTPKSHIHVTIASKHLSVIIRDLLAFDSDEDEEIEEDAPKETFPLPRYAMKELWGEVDAESSLWTWDKEGERTVGLLTLHLEKKHEGTRWTHVFSREGPTEPEVQEVVDPSELANIRENLEKYTSELSEDAITGEIPSLAQGEIDPSVDDEVGRRSTISSFDILTGEEVAVNTAYVEVLSFPLPWDQTNGSEDGVKLRSLTIKNGIDGPLFVGPVSPSVDGWEHVSTFPALSFVLASKRDTKFVFHVGQRAVIALESGGREVGPNMYVYHDAQEQSRAKQGVVRIGGDGRKGALVGVAGFEVDGRTVLVCLREKELVIVNGFL